jgi:hypothetical protein
MYKSKVWVGFAVKICMQIRSQTIGPKPRERHAIVVSSTAM